MRSDRELIPKHHGAVTCSPTHPHLRVLSLKLDVLTQTDLVSLILRSAAERTGAIFTYATAHTVVQAHRARSFRETADLADVCYADGMGVVLAARAVTGRRLPKVTANEFFPTLVSGVVRRGLRLALVGAAPGVAEAAIRKVMQDMAGNGPCDGSKAQWCRCYSGYLDDAEDVRILTELEAWQPHLVVVGMGQPHQENWAARARLRLPGTTFHCVGGLFDVLSGEIGSPPDWMRRNGLEWLYRLIDQPGATWRRYLLGLPVFACLTLREALVARFLRKRPVWG